jgi:hypothetical protein
MVNSLYHILYQPKGVPTSRDNFSRTGSTCYNQEGIIIKQLQQVRPHPDIPHFLDWTWPKLMFHFRIEFEWMDGYREWIAFSLGLTLCIAHYNCFFVQMIGADKRNSFLSYFQGKEHIGDGKALLQAENLHCQDQCRLPTWHNEILYFEVCQPPTRP